MAHSTAKRKVGNTLKSKQAPLPRIKSHIRTSDKVIRLYELPPREHVIIHYVDLVVEFVHLDGMYSYCTVLEGKNKGNILHLSANTPLYHIGGNEYEVPE